MRAASNDLDRQQKKLLNKMKMTARTVGELAHRMGNISENEVRRLIDRARGQGNHVQNVAPKTFIFLSE